MATTDCLYGASLAPSLLPTPDSAQALPPFQAPQSPLSSLGSALLPSATAPCGTLFKGITDINSLLPTGMQVGACAVI